MNYKFHDFQKAEYKTGKTWEFDPIKDIIFKDRVKITPSFGRCFNYNYNLTKRFLDINIKRLRNSDDHLTIEITGTQGSGKSRLAQRLATLLGYTDDKIHIVFNIEECLQIATKAKRGDLIIIDDQRELAGTGAQREGLELKALVETIRAFGLSIFLLSPSAKNTETSLHYRIEVMQTNRELRLTKASIQHSGIYAGYLVVDIPLDDQDEIYKKYLPLKEKFVQEDALNREKNIRTDYKAMAEKVKNHKKYHKFIPRGAVDYIIREQNPRITQEEVKYCIKAFGVYVGFNKKDKSKTIKKPRQKFQCSKCDELTYTYMKIAPQRCPHCGARGWNPKHLGEVADADLQGN